MIRLPLAFLLLFCPAALASGLKNVYQQDLASCSTSGMAKTGFTRSSQCEDVKKDAGSHNVCIDISSTTQNFCEVTGQPNWCDNPRPCDEDKDTNCPVSNWCVCEWAFKGYLQTAGGCDEVAEIICEATNAKVVQHYQAKIAEGDSEAEEALECLKKRCEGIVLE